MSSRGKTRNDAARRLGAWLRAGNWPLLVLAAVLVGAGALVYAEVSGKLELRAPSPEVAWSPPAVATPAWQPVPIAHKPASTQRRHRIAPHRAAPAAAAPAQPRRRVALIPKPHFERRVPARHTPRTVVDAIVYRKPVAFSAATAQPPDAEVQTSAAEFARGLVQASDPQASVQRAAIVSNSGDRIVVEVLSFEDGVALTDQFTLRAQKGEYTVEKYERLPGEAQSAPSQVCYRRGEWYPC